MVALIAAVLGNAVMEKGVDANEEGPVANPLMEVLAKHGHRMKRNYCIAGRCAHTPPACDSGYECNSRGYCIYRC